MNPPQSICVESFPTSMFRDSQHTRLVVKSSLLCISHFATIYAILQINSKEENVSSIYERKLIKMLKI